MYKHGSSCHDNHSLNVLLTKLMFYLRFDNIYPIFTDRFSQQDHIVYFVIG